MPRGPIEEALSFISPDSDWDNFIEALCAVRGVPVPEVLLKRNAQASAPERTVEKRAGEKRTFWLTKMTDGKLTPAFLAALEARDPRSAKFVRWLIAENRRRFKLGDDEELP